MPSAVRLFLSDKDGLYLNSTIGILARKIFIRRKP